MCLWCYVHLAQARVMNNYAGVLYMQGACIFMQGGVMECMVRLVRLGVGGNFFHTLEPKTFFVGSVFHRICHNNKERRCRRLSPCFHGFHLVFQFRLLSS